MAATARASIRHAMRARDFDRLRWHAERGEYPDVEQMAVMVVRDDDLEMFRFYDQLNPALTRTPAQAANAMQPLRSWNVFRYLTTLDPPVLPEDGDVEYWDILKHPNRDEQADEQAAYLVSLGLYPEADDFYSAIVYGRLAFAQWMVANPDRVRGVLDPSTITIDMWYLGDLATLEWAHAQGVTIDPDEVIEGLVHDAHRDRNRTEILDWIDETFDVQPIQGQIDDAAEHVRLDVIEWARQHGLPFPSPAYRTGSLELIVYLMGHHVLPGRDERITLWDVWSARLPAYLEALVRQPDLDPPAEFPGVFYAARDGHYSRFQHRQMIDTLDAAVERRPDLIDHFEQLKRALTRLSEGGPLARMSREERRAAVPLLVTGMRADREMARNRGRRVTPRYHGRHPASQHGAQHALHRMAMMPGDI